MSETAAKMLTDSIHQWKPILLNLEESIARHQPRERWSIAEVVGHLVDSACNNHQRFIRAQEGSSLTFPKYEQNEWVAGGKYQSYAWPDLVELWAGYNFLIAHIIAGVPAEMLDVSCTITPYDPCSLEFLIVDYVDHLQHHLQKIKERLNADHP